MKFGKRIASGALAFLLAATVCVGSGATASAATAGQTAIMQQWVEEGLLTGDPDGALRPDDTITRAEFVHLMVLIGFTGDGTGVSYTDVEYNAWYYADIASATGAGYVSGRANGSFGPRETITRQEGAAMVARALNLPMDYTTGADETCSEWFIGEIGAVIGAGLYGSGTDFTADLTRAEAVALLDAVRGEVTTGIPGVSGTSTGLSADEDDTVTGEDVTVTKKSDSVSGTVANMTISSKLGSNAYTLDDVVITGDLIIESTGTITLDDVAVKGSIIIEGSNAKVVLKSSADVSTVEFHDSGTISGTSYKGTLDKVILDTDSKSDVVYLKVDAKEVILESPCYLHIESDVDSLVAESGSKNAEIEIVYGAEIDEVELNAAVELYGSGDIGKLYINASSCTISKYLDIGKTTKASGVKSTSYTYRDDDDAYDYYYDKYWDKYWGPYWDGYGPGYDNNAGAVENTKSMEVGDKDTLKTTPPSDSAKLDVTWSSSASKIVSVNARTGEIEAVATGTAYIYAKDSNGRTVERWTITVTAKTYDVKVETNGSTNINVTSSQGSYKEGDTVKISFTVTGATSINDITASANSGSVTLEKNASFSDNSDKSTWTITFKMPADNVTITLSLTTGTNTVEDEPQTSSITSSESTEQLAVETPEKTPSVEQGETNLTTTSTEPEPQITENVAE